MSQVPPQGTDQEAVGTPKRVGEGSVTTQVPKGRLKQGQT